MTRRTNLNLTPEVIEQLGQVLRAGNYVDTAAKMVGVPRSTLYRWLAHGDTAALKDEAGEPLTDNEALYLQLLNTVEQARATATVRNVALVQQAAQNHWQAAAWWLERTSPKEWGRKVQTEVVGANSGPVQINVSADDLETLVQSILHEPR